MSDRTFCTSNLGRGRGGAIANFHISQLCCRDTASSNHVGHPKILMMPCPYKNVHHEQQHNNSKIPVFGKMEKLLLSLLNRFHREKVIN